MNHVRIQSGMFVLALLGLLLAPVATDVSAQTGTPTSSEPPSETQMILIQASKRLAETQTIRFELKIDGDTFIDDGHTLRLLEAKGELVRPDRVRTDFKLKVMGTVTISTSMIIVGDQRWSTDLITGSWGDAPEEFGYDPGILFDNVDGIGPVMDKIADPVLVDEEKIRDRETFHIIAQVNPEILDELTSGTMTGNPIDVDLWIDKETYDVLQVRLAESKETVKDRDPAIWTLEITDQDKPFTIDPPV